MWFRSKEEDARRLHDEALERLGANDLDGAAGGVSSTPASHRSLGAVAEDGPGFAERANDASRR